MFHHSCIPRWTFSAPYDCNKPIERCFVKWVNFLKNYGREWDKHCFHFKNIIQTKAIFFMHAIQSWTFLASCYNKPTECCFIKWVEFLQNNGWEWNKHGLNKSWWWYANLWYEIRFPFIQILIYTFFIMKC